VTNPGGILNERLEYSRMRLDQLRKQLAKLPEVAGFPALTIFGAGSYARLEASKYSDIDMFFLSNGARDDVPETPHKVSSTVWQNYRDHRSKLTQIVLGMSLQQFKRWVLISSTSFRSRNGQIASQVIPQRASIGARSLKNTQSSSASMAPRERASLVWRRQYPKRFDVEGERSLSREEFYQLTDEEKARVSRTPLTPADIKALIDTAINLHSQSLEQRKERRWWIPLASAIGGLVGGIAGAFVNGS
jgi:hypothetical protein